MSGTAPEPPNEPTTPSDPGAIQKVWIEEGCISCSLCQDIAPDVFDVPDGEDCRVRAQAAKFFRGKDEDIQLAADDCPVEVIHVERGDGET